MIKQTIQSTDGLMESSYPTDLLDVDPFGSPCHAFWPKIRPIRKHTGEHRQYVPRNVSRSDMGAVRRQVTVRHRTQSDRSMEFLV
ncbi:MAG: hypothetical protein CML23_13990 [Rhizobiaceae bacterium]|nr:hypothetical protein [Rhizobiaceae bacterium]